MEDIKYNICGNDIRIYRETLLKIYTADFVDRIFPKSQRMTGEIKKNLSQFLKSIPIRIITKPYRIAHESTDILQKDKGKRN